MSSAEHIRAARELMRSGRLDYHLLRLCEHSEALLTRFAPVKAGGRAVIVEPVKCSDGWKGSERTLSVGAVGEVKSVDYRDGRFVYHFVPDNQWWRDDDGKWHAKDVLHSYCLSERVLSPIESHPDGRASGGDSVDGPLATLQGNGDDAEN